MIRKNSKVKVHIFDSNNKVIKTRVHGEVFNVYEENGKLGITWNKNLNHLATLLQVYTLKTCDW